jgi:hypothetical protein
MHRLRAFTIAAAATVLAASAASAADKPPFPRLGGINIGNPMNFEDTGYQAQLARLDMSILNIFPGWEKTHGPLETVVKNIKAINPNSKVFLYHISMELSEESSAAAFASVREKVSAQKWWLYRQGTSGDRVLSEFAVQTNKPVYTVNTTLFTPKDASGYQYWEWDARQTVQNFFKPAPSLDGFFEDNVFWKPRTDGDWNRDGVIDSAGSAQAATWLRQGYKARFSLLRTLMPGKLQIGNVADWGDPKAVLTDLSGQLNGGVMEALIGKNYSIERYGGFTPMLNWYRKTMAALAEPKLAIFHQAGSPTDYQAMRYGLGTCLLDDGYYYFSDNAKGFTGVVWFDEYDANLGQAISAPPSSAWQNGVYRRDFEGGIALVNPKGNGVREVTLEEDFKRISGKQATSVNNGQTARKITLQDRDGIILLRTKRSLVPEAPELVRVD